MNTYYTAKDIEEMAARGVRQLELDPGVVLTDFARETAQQFNITLVASGSQASRAPQNAATQLSSKYNKPKGCQPGSRAAGTSAANPAFEGANSATANQLIDLMGKMVKRGG